ncbi:hypothetical protein QBC45DRAFT_325118, partial [Copromyces sp. CBS 386.78]
NGSSSAAFTARGGLFESASKGGFVERADALISMGGPGMGGSRRWTPEAAAELARLTNIANNVEKADFEANTSTQAKNSQTQPAKLAGQAFWGRNLFPTRRKSECDLDPRDLNREFEKEAKAAKRAENLLILEKYLLAKEQPPTHLLPTRKSVTFLLGNYSSKESRASKEPCAKKRAKTWPRLTGGSLFTIAEREKENENPNGKGSGGNSHRETFKTLVRRLTGTGKNR